MKSRSKLNSLTSDKNKRYNYKKKEINTEIEREGEIWRKKDI